MKQGKGTADLMMPFGDWFIFFFLSASMILKGENFRAEMKPSMLPGFLHCDMAQNVKYKAKPEMKPAKLRARFHNQLAQIVKHEMKLAKIPGCSRD